MVVKAEGVSSKIAMKKAAAWGTPILCGANDQVSFISENVRSNKDLVANPSINGSVLPDPADAGNESCAGTTVHKLRAEEHDLALSLLYGGLVAVTGAGPYVHIYKALPSVQGLFVTLCVYKSFEVWEFDSMKVKSGEFAVTNAGGESLWQLTLEYLGRTVARNTGSGTNKNSTVASWSPVTADGPLLKFEGTKVYLDPIATVGAMAEVCVSNARFKFDRPLGGDITTCQPGLMDEPTADGSFPTISGSLVIPAYSDSHGTLWDAAQAKSQYRMRITVTRTVGATTWTYEFNFPCVQLTADGPNIGGPGKVPFTLNFAAATAAAAPDGMTYTVPYLKATNNNPGDLWTANAT